MHIRQCFITLIRDEEGVATVEYALLLAGLIVGLSVTWQPLGNTMANTGGPIRAKEPNRSSPPVS